MQDPEYDTLGLYQGPVSPHYSKGTLFPTIRVEQGDPKIKRAKKVPFSNLVIRVLYMKPNILGVIGPGFLNQAPALTPHQ